MEKIVVFASIFSQFSVFGLWLNWLKSLTFKARGKSGIVTIRYIQIYKVKSTYNPGLSITLLFYHKDTEGQRKN